MTNNEFIAKFRIAFPELSAALDERVLYFYSLAQDEMNAGVWANLYEQGILNLVAHMLVGRYGSNGNGSPNTAVQQEVTSKTVAKLSKGMASRNSDIYAGAGDYAFTVYGRRYWELLQKIKPTGMVIAGGFFGGCGCAGARTH